MPDPSDRHWRHPSELAAMGAASTPPTMREAPLGPMVLTGVLAVGAVSGLLVALSVGGLTLFDTGGMRVADGDLTGAAIGQHTSDGAEAPTGTVVDEQTTTTAANTLTSTSLPLTPPASSEAELEVWSASSPGATAAEVLLLAYGVFASPNVDDRLASYLVHDGMVVTSAAAVSGRDSIWLRVAGRWSPASVAMVDPYTDVAVLQTAEPLPDDLSSPNIAAARPEPGASVTVRLGPTGIEAADDAERTGIVASPSEPVKTSLNRNCYDAFTTSLHSSLAPPGSPVVDPDGAVIGMTISAPQPTTAAVPIATVIEVARSMMELGSPAAVWLGIEAGADTEGRTRVIAVVDSGPAADILMADDVIVSIDGHAVENPDHLVHLVRDIGTGVDAQVVIERDGTAESVSLRPAPVTAKP